MNLYKVLFRIQGYHRNTHVVALDEEDAEWHVNDKDNCEVISIEEVDLERSVVVTDRAAAESLGSN